MGRRLRAEILLVSLVLASLVENSTSAIMTKPDLIRDLAGDIDYEIADAAPEAADPAHLDEVVDPDYEPAADPDYDDTVQADYEPTADPDYDEPLAEPQTAPAGPVRAAGFAFELGRAVLPRTQAQAHPVVWRGHLKERHPATGLVHRVPVYRLADGYWDCYREEELQVA